MTTTAADSLLQRYLAHALGGRTDGGRRARLRMRGHIKVGAWLRFDSTWEGDGRSFSWRALAGPGPLGLLRVHDAFADGRGFMDIRLRGGLKLLHSENEDTARSGAGRAALEALWVPTVLAPGTGVDWREAGDGVLVASWDVPPERPEVHIRVDDDDGRVRSYSVLRWSGGKDGYLPFGAEVHSEARFGDVTIPSSLTAGWGFGTPSWSPFFRAEVTAFELLG